MYMVLYLVVFCRSEMVVVVFVYALLPEVTTVSKTVTTFGKDFQSNVIRCESKRYSEF